MIKYLTFLMITSSLVYGTIINLPPRGSHTLINRQMLTGVWYYSDTLRIGEDIDGYYSSIDSLTGTGTLRVLVQYRISFNKKSFTDWDSLTSIQATNPGKGLNIPACNYLQMRFIRRNGTISRCKSIVGVR